MSETHTYTHSHTYIDTQILATENNTSPKTKFFAEVINKNISMHFCDDPTLYKFNKIIAIAKWHLSIVTVYLQFFISIIKFILHAKEKGSIEQSQIDRKYKN